jgi:hypothetical protein
MNFHVLKEAVAKQFAEMCKSKQLYRTGILGDDLWATYLSSFPEGTNPIYRERTEHDCSCCKSFIRAVGNVVAIVDGKVVSIWDVTLKGKEVEPYQTVADALAKRVKMFAITDTFLHWDKVAGADKTFEQLVDGQKTWQHFFVNIPAKYVKPGRDIPSALNVTRTAQQVFARALTEITPEAVDTVLELIGQNSLYRGEEHKFTVSKFRELQRKAVQPVNTYAWAGMIDLPGSVTGIRNTSIGTLLVDLSEGMDLEAAVKKFEAMVAPTNYKRPTALVTQAMIDKAKAELNELGLVSALQRRFARLSDINVNNVLFVNRSARKSVVGGDLFDDVKPTKAATTNLDKVEDVPVEKFLKDILHRVNTIEVMVENRHTPNFVSLIAPVDPTAKPLFKWGNPFSWSYNGEVADSIKERVKAAGGRIEGDLCCRLAWHNKDDLDFHMHEPQGHRIYYGCRRQVSPCGGLLDVDANGTDGQRNDPAENIVYADKNRMKTGIYELKVNQFSQRSRENVGFVVEIEAGGQVFTMVYEKPVTGNIHVANIHFDAKTKELRVEPLLPTSTASKEVWAVATHQFQPVSVVMHSPNHWDGEGVGNKHLFFMLEHALNDGSARGFYNEFLHSDLDKHRKVLELVGSKTKVLNDAQALNGLGFSSTQRNSLLCRLTGNFTRTINIIF